MGMNPLTMTLAIASGVPPFMPPMNKGGVVSGDPATGDSVKAKLTPGETVIPSISDWHSQTIAQHQFDTANKLRQARRQALLGYLIATDKAGHSNGT